VLYGVPNGGTKPGMRSVKQGDWKLVKFDVLGGAVRETQLFNLRENPHEFIEQPPTPTVIALTGITPTLQQRNLAPDPHFATKLAEMESLFRAEMRRLDDPWHLWNQPNDGLTPSPDAPTERAKKKQSVTRTPPFPSF
jgi:choline-sulfatase